MMKILLPLSLCFLALLGNAQLLNEGIKVNDLKSEWKVFTDESFHTFSRRAHAGTKMIYFEVDPGRYERGSLLKIESSKPFSIYLNYKLLHFRSESRLIEMDSLNNLLPTPWLFSIYQADGLSWLQTVIISPHVIQASYDNFAREPSFYQDFSILAFITLLLIFAALLRTNPKLTLDYFNFVRLFSLQERDETLLNSRISSSTNILYYGFCSLSLGFILLIIFHFGADRISIAESFTIHSLGEAFFQWIKLSSLVMAALVIKLFVISGLALLFDFREAPSLQFYSSVRLFFFILTVSGLICLGYFVFKIQRPDSYSFLLTGIILVLVFWVFIIGLKLMSRTSFRSFHLFSYLCASELIPVVILVKVLNS